MSGARVTHPECCSRPLGQLAAFSSVQQNALASLIGASGLRGLASPEHLRALPGPRPPQGRRAGQQNQPDEIRTTKDLNYQLKELCRTNRDGSCSTQANRERILDQMANQLQTLGFRRMRAKTLNPAESR